MILERVESKDAQGGMGARLWGREVWVCYQAADLHLCQETQSNLQFVMLNLNPTQ